MAVYLPQFTEEQNPYITGKFSLSDRTSSTLAEFETFSRVISALLNHSSEFRDTVQHHDQTIHLYSDCRAL